MPYPRFKNFKNTECQTKIHTTADTHVSRPHVLKLATQDLWDASDLKTFPVHQQGATCAEIGECDDKPMSYVAALHFVRN